MGDEAALTRFLEKRFLGQYVSLISTSYPTLDSIRLAPEDEIPKMLLLLPKPGLRLKFRLLIEDLRTPGRRKSEWTRASVNNPITPPPPLGMPDSDDSDDSDSDADSPPLPFPAPTPGLGRRQHSDSDDDDDDDADDDDSDDEVKLPPPAKGKPGAASRPSVSFKEDTAVAATARRKTEQGRERKASRDSSDEDSDSDGAGEDDVVPPAPKEESGDDAPPPAPDSEEEEEEEAAKPREANVEAGPGSRASASKAAASSAGPAAPRKVSDSEREKLRDIRTLLATGGNFIKYKRKAGKKRLIWCPPSLDRVLWGSDKGKPKGYILVSDISAIVPGCAGAKKPSSAFTIVTASRDLELEAESETVKDEWVSALEYVRRNC